MDFKKAGYKLLTYLPGVGLIAYGAKEIKTRKGKSPWYNLKEGKDRKALGVYALEVAYLAYALSWKVYVGKGVATGNWNPFKFNDKDKTEQVEGVLDKKKKNLEKCVDYQELVK
jgi:hypothetical protein